MANFKTALLNKCSFTAQPRSWSALGTAMENDGADNGYSGLVSQGNVCSSYPVSLSARPLHENLARLAGREKVRLQQPCIARQLKDELYGKSLSDGLLLKGQKFLNSDQHPDQHMAKPDNQLETFHATNRQQWREWLEENHHTSLGVWLIYYKVKSGKPSIRYSEAVKEALCFGWIDSKVKSIDSEHYMQIFTPRKPKSVWSKLNKQYIEELIEQGLMTPSGLEKIETAKQNGSWNTLDAIEELTIPADLKQALEANETANRYFEAFSNSSKKNILFWIESAKRPETRLMRIEQTVSSAEQNKNPLARG